MLLLLEKDDKPESVLINAKKILLQNISQCGINELADALKSEMLLNVANCICNDTRDYWHQVRLSKWTEQLQQFTNLCNGMGLEKRLCLVAHNDFEGTSPLVSKS